MSLAHEIRNIKSTRKELRDFGLIVGGVLLAVAAVLFYYGRPNYVYFGAIGGALFACGAIFPRVLLPLQKVWMALAVVMGWVMTRVIIIMLFSLVLTPIGVVSRVFGKRFLDTGIDPSSKSYWSKREAQGAKTDYERQF